MDAIIGIRTKSFTLIASDTTINRSSLVIKTDESKISTINTTIVAYAGEQSDAFRTLSLAKEISILKSLRHNTLVTPKSVANTIQNEVYTALRTSPINTEWLIGGGNFELIFIDVYGAKLKGNYFCLGSARYFGYGRLDELYDENMTVEDALSIVRDIGNVLKKRFVKRFDKFDVRIVCSEGVRESVIQIE